MLLKYPESKNIRIPNKYIVYFKESAREINPVKLDTKKKGSVPQAPRYTTYEKLMKGKVLSDVF